MKRAAVAASLFIMVLTALVVVSGPAEAATSAEQKYVTVTRPYTQNWVYRSTSLKACIFVEIRGSMRGTHRYAYHSAGGSGWDTRTYYWYNIKLLNPSIRAVGWAIRGAGCDSTRKVAIKKITLSQSWSEGRCKLKVQVSAGYPWSVQVTPSYSCKKVQVAHRVTSYTRPGPNGAKQNNGGAPVTFKGAILAPSNQKSPFRANLRVTAYRKIGKGTVSDAFATRKAVAYL